MILSSISNRGTCRRRKRRSKWLTCYMWSSLCNLVGVIDNPVHFDYPIRSGC